MRKRSKFDSFVMECKISETRPKGESGNKRTRVGECRFYDVASIDEVNSGLAKAATTGLITASDAMDIKEKAKDFALVGIYWGKANIEEDGYHKVSTNSGHIVRNEMKKKTDKIQALQNIFNTVLGQTDATGEFSEAFTLKKRKK